MRIINLKIKENIPNGKIIQNISFNKKGLKPLHIFRMCDNIIKANFKVQTQGVFLLCLTLNQLKREFWYPTKKGLKTKWFVLR